MRRVLWRPRYFGYGFKGVGHPHPHPHPHHQSRVPCSSHLDLLSSPSPTRLAGHVPIFPKGLRSICSFAHGELPIIRDPDIQSVFHDFMAASWSNLPDDIIANGKKALSKNTKDTAGREMLENVFRAAEAVEEFGGILVTLRNEIDDFIGMSGKKIGPLPYEHAYALDEVYKRYEEYLEAFGSDEEYLRKKVETELGTKIIHLKMRCSFLDSQ